MDSTPHGPGAGASTEVTVAFDPTAVAGLDALLERAQATLANAGAGDDTAGAASSANGLVHARVRADRLESLEFGREAMRIAPAELAAAIREAVNRAFDAGARDAADSARAAGAALADEVRDIQNESMRTMSMFVTAMRDATARFERERS
jgi:hypothetical protein